MPPFKRVILDTCHRRPARHCLNFSSEIIVSIVYHTVSCACPNLSHQVFMTSINYLKQNQKSDLVPTDWLNQNQQQQQSCTRPTFNYLPRLIWDCERERDRQRVWFSIFPFNVTHNNNPRAQTHPAFLFSHVNVFIPPSTLQQVSLNPTFRPPLMSCFHRDCDRYWGRASSRMPTKLIILIEL